MSRFDDHDKWKTVEHRGKKVFLIYHNKLDTHTDTSVSHVFTVYNTSALVNTRSTQKITYKGYKTTACTVQSWSELNDHDKLENIGNNTNFTELTNWITYIDTFV